MAATKSAFSLIERKNKFILQQLLNQSIKRPFIAI